MINKLLIYIILFSSAFLSCRRSDQQISSNSKAAIISPTKHIDTSAIIKILSFNSIDSCYIHPELIAKHFGDRRIETYHRVLVSSYRPQIDVRCALSIRGNDKVSHFGSYVFLYKDINDNSIINRIRLDSIEIYLASISFFNPLIKFVDINYDGFKDIVISFTQNEYENSGYNCFLTFDTLLNRFEPDSVLNKMFHEAEINIDEDKKEILCGGRVGYSNYSEETYRWNGKKYELYAKLETNFGKDGGTITSKRKELVNGKWVIVKPDTSMNK